MLTMILSDEVQSIVQRIEKHRTGSDPLLPSDMVKLFHSRELDTVLNADEAAHVASMAAGRPISTDYIKRLRLTGRLRAKKVNERAYIFTLKDVLLLEYRPAYKRKPPGRPRKQP